MKCTGTILLKVREDSAYDPPLVLLIEALHFPLCDLLLKFLHLCLLLELFLSMKLVCILGLALNSLIEDRRGFSNNRGQQHGIVLPKLPTWRNLMYLLTSSSKKAT